MKMQPEDAECEHGRRHQTLGTSQKNDKFLLLLCRKRECKPIVFPVTIGER